jgi:hypothetical protein
MFDKDKIKFDIRNKLLFNVQHFLYIVQNQVINSCIDQPIGYLKALPELSLDS